MMFSLAWILKDYVSQTLDLTSPDSYREYVVLLLQIPNLR